MIEIIDIPISEFCLFPDNTEAVTNEVVKIRPQDIDSEKLLLHVIQGKGAKDRVVPIPAKLIPEWLFFWSQHRSQYWLFPTPYKKQTKDHFSASAAQKMYTRAKRTANIHKVGGIHALRHAFATHSLMYGMSIQPLQAILGHRHLSTTMNVIILSGCIMLVAIVIVLAAKSTLQRHGNRPNYHILLRQITFILYLRCPMKSMRGQGYIQKSFTHVFFNRYGKR